MTKNLIIPALMGMAALVSSCGKSEVENAYTQQDKNIESLVKSLAPEESEATVDYLDGVVRVTVKHGEGAALESGGTVSFYYAGHCINSSSLSSGNMFVTNSKEFAESYNWTVTDSTIFQVSTVDLAKDNLVKGLKKRHRRGSRPEMNVTSCSTESTDSGSTRTEPCQEIRLWPIICG